MKTTLTTSNRGNVESFKSTAEWMAMEWLAKFQILNLTPEDICAEARTETPAIEPIIVKAGIVKAARTMGVPLRSEATPWLGEAVSFLNGE